VGGVEIEDVIRAVAAVLLSGKGENTLVIWVGRKSWEEVFLAVRSPIARFAMNGEERVGESPD
jgi:site-specific recombinase XerC